jgi:hypothetical protein
MCFPMYSDVSGRAKSQNFSLGGLGLKNKVEQKLIKNIINKINKQFEKAFFSCEHLIPIVIGNCKLKRSIFLHRSRPCF